MDEELYDEDYNIDDDWDDDEEDNIIEIEHVVKPGFEDIIYICSEYGITDWKSVAELNNIKDPNSIKAGDVIIIEKSEDDI